jgi:hypothetical protein
MPQIPQLQYLWLHIFTGCLTTHCSSQAELTGSQLQITHNTRNHSQRTMNSLQSLSTDLIENASPSSSSILRSHGYHSENTIPLLLFTVITYQQVLFTQLLLSNGSTCYNIATCSWLDTEFGLIIEFTEHLQFVTTITKLSLIYTIYKSLLQTQSRRCLIALSNNVTQTHRLITSTSSFQLLAG